MSLEVNGELVEDEVIEEEFQYYLHHYRNQGEVVDKAELLEWVKEEIVLKTLLHQEVNKEKQTISEPNLKREIAHFSQFNDKAKNLSDQQLRSYVLYKLKEEQLLNRVTQDMDSPQQSHLQIFYEDNKEDYRTTRFEWIEIKWSLGEEAREDLKFKINDLKGHGKLNDFLENFIAKGQAIKTIYHGFEPQLTSDAQAILQHLKEHLISELFLTPVILFRDSELTVNQSSQSVSASSNVNTVKNSTCYFYYLCREESNYLPNFKEIEVLIRDDLLKEMRRLKFNIYLRKKMKTSRIVDNQYLG